MSALVHRPRRADGRGRRTSRTTMASRSGRSGAASRPLLGCGTGRRRDPARRRRGSVGARAGGAQRLVLSARVSQRAVAGKLAWRAAADASKLDPSVRDADRQPRSRRCRASRGDRGARGSAARALRSRAVNATAAARDASSTARRSRLAAKGARSTGHNHQAHDVRGGLLDRLLAPRASEPYAGHAAGFGFVLRRCAGESTSLPDVESARLRPVARAVDSAARLVARLRRTG